MSLDVTGILEKAIPSLLAGAGGAVGTFLKMRSQKDKAIEDQFKDMTKLLTEELGARDVKIEELKKQLTEAVNRTNTLARDLQDVERTLTDRSNEMRSMRETMHGIVQDGIRLRSMLDNQTDAIQKLDSELGAFVKSLEERWQHMMRTIGQMEGTLAAAARRISGAFQSPIIPK